MQALDTFFLELFPLLKEIATHWKLITVALISLLTLMLFATREILSWLTKQNRTMRELKKVHASLAQLQSDIEVLKRQKSGEGITTDTQTDTQSEKSSNHEATETPKSAAVAAKAEPKKFIVTH